MQLSDKQFDFITKEIRLVFSQIDKQRDSTTTFLKIYISIILGLFAYIYFIDTRVITEGGKNNLPNTTYASFGIFGIVICAVTFMIGWALLDNVTKAVYKSIKYYKHISYLRNIIADTFPDDTLKRNSILPFREQRITMRISKQVPIIGGIVNFGLLLLMFYFLKLFCSIESSYIATMITITIISVFYSNQLEKHFEEILIAQELLPEKREEDIKKIVRRLISLQKRGLNYRITQIIYFVLVTSVIFSSIFIFTSKQFDLAKGNTWIGILPIILFISTIIPRTFMGVHRLKKIKCIE